MKQRPQICDIVTVDCEPKDSFFREYNGALTRWRVSGFLKQLPTPTLESLKAECKDGFVAEFIWENISEQIQAGTYKPRMTWSLEHEATHVCLAGIAGATVEIEHCNVVGRVKWPQKLINEEVEKVKNWAGRANSKAFTPRLRGFKLID